MLLGRHRWCARSDEPKQSAPLKRLHARRMRHPNGIAELEQQLQRHFHPLPPPGQAPSTELFQQFIYLTQARRPVTNELFWELQISIDWQEIGEHLHAHG